MLGLGRIVWQVGGVLVGMGVGGMPVVCCLVSRCRRGKLGWLNR